MTRRKRDRKSKPIDKRPAAGPAGAPDGQRLRRWLAGAVCALFVVQPLVAGDSAGSRGDGLVVVMLWIALGVCWMLGAIGRSEFRLRFGWTDAAVLLLVGWHTVAALWAAHTGSPRPAMNMLWVWIGFGLSFLLARQLLTGRREIRAMLVVMIALAVGLSGYAVYQRLVEMPATWKKYENDKVGALRAAGVWAEPGSTEAILFEKRLYSYEPLGTFSLTNSLAGYLAPWLVVGLGIGFAAGLGGRRRLANLLAVAACAVAITVCLLWTKSRSGYVAALLGLPLAWWLCRNRRRPGGWKLGAAAAGVAIVLAGGLLAARKLDARILTEASLSLGYRMQYWQSSMAMIKDHPFVGCGPGQFQNAYTAYKLPTASEEIADPHNFLLEAWATAGTPAALALLAVLACYGWTMLAGRVERADGPGGRLPISRGQEATVRGEKRQRRPGEASTQQPDAVPHVLVGAALGLLLSLPLGLTSSAPPSLAVIWLGFPLAAAAVGMFWVWVREERLPTLLPLVGVVVLLVHLLAAGGIGFPGVSGTLWLLLAVGLNAAEARPPQRVSQKTALAAVAVAILLALACYTTAYRPVLECRGQMQAASQDPARGEQHLLAATAADPLDADPWNRLAGMAFARWQRQPSLEAFGDFQAYQQKVLDRAPESASARAAAAERYLAAFQASGQADSLQKGVELYRQAVRRYPNHPTYRANLALALRAAGDTAGFRREAARALELDALTPHADQKLDDKLRTILQRSRVAGE